MAEIRRLPIERSRQELFEEMARDQSKARNRPLTEMELVLGAQMMGAADPFPIGMQFSNQAPVPAPARKAAVERANMREAHAAKQALLEAGIRRAEQGVEKKIAVRQRNPGVDFRGGSNFAVDPQRRALYESALAERDAARSSGMDMASADLQRRLGRMGGGDVGVLMRRDPRAAVALMSAQMNAEQAGYDRQSANELAMTRLDAQMGDSAAERMMRAGLAERTMAHQSQQSGLDRDARLDALRAQLLAAATEGGLSRQHAAAMQGNQLTAQENARKANESFESKFRMTPEQAAAADDKKAMRDARLGILANPDIVDPNERIEAMFAAVAPVGTTQSTQAAAPFPNFRGTLASGMEKHEDIASFLDSLPMGAADTPDEQAAVRRAVQGRYGMDAYEKFLASDVHGGWFGNSPNERYAKQNVLRYKVGEPMKKGMYPEDFSLPPIYPDGMKLTMDRRLYEKLKREGKLPRGNVVWDIR